MLYYWYIDTVLVYWVCYVGNLEYCTQSYFGIFYTFIINIQLLYTLLFIHKEFLALFYKCRVPILTIKFGNLYMWLLQIDDS